MLLPAEAGGAGLGTAELSRPAAGLGASRGPVGGARRRVRLALQADMRTMAWSAAGRLLEGAFSIPTLASIRVGGGEEGSVDEADTRVVLSFATGEPALHLVGPSADMVAEWVSGLTLLHDILPAGTGASQ